METTQYLHLGAAVAVAENSRIYTFRASVYIIKISQPAWAFVTST
jgi:hypothetical protein